MSEDFTQAHLGDQLLTLLLQSSPFYFLTAYLIEETIST